MPRIEYTKVVADDNSHILKVQLVSGMFLQGMCMCVCVYMCVCMYV